MGKRWKREWFSVLTGYEAEPNYPAYTNTKEKLILEDGSQVDVYTNQCFISLCLVNGR